MRIAPLCALLAACMTAGCGVDVASMTPIGGVEASIAVPSKFESYDCTQLQNMSNALVQREWQLRGLMERSSEGGGGTVVNAVVYWPDLASVRADRRLLDKTAARKKCTLKSPALTN